MSQPKKRDIADFFRPHARVIPQKRSTPGPDDDTIVVDTILQPRESTPQTPATTRVVNHDLAGLDVPSTVRSPVRPLATPRSGRTISIPIRSPLILSPAKPSPSTRSLFFDLSSQASKASPKPFDPNSFSFADLPTSNRKVIEDGKLVAIQDSDDDNESLASLESLTDLLPRKKNGHTSPSAEIRSRASKNEEERIRILSMYTGGRSNPILNKERLRALQRQQQDSRFDINFLVKEQQASAKADEKIKDANAEIEQSTEELELDKRNELDKKMLAAILRGTSQSQDPEDLARILNAVERTEAFSAEKTYSFFGKPGSSKAGNSPQKKQRSFPATSIPHSLWRPRDIEARNRAYLSGFMADRAAAGQLSDVVMKWTFDSAAQEASDDLQQAYISCISAGSRTWTRANLTPGDIHHIFSELGAESTSLRDNTEIKPQSSVKQQLQKTETRSILAALRLLYKTCQDMDYACLSKLISTVSRLCLDQEVMTNVRVSQAVEDLLEKLVDLPDSDSRQHVHDRLILDLGTNLTDSILQDRFLSHFMPSSASAVELRIKLATSFLLGLKAAHRITTSGTKNLLAILTNHVSTSSAFSNTYLASSSGPDYAQMTASVGILDAALADGHQGFLLTPNPMSSNFDIQKLLIANKTEENEFNANIDRLADKLHDLFVGIADSGASHMRRTEAKDAIQALHYRLLHSVRTKPRRKKHIFDPQESLRRSKGIGAMRDADEVLEETRGKDFMIRFLKRNEDSNTPEVDIKPIEIHMEQNVQSDLPTLPSKEENSDNVILPEH